MVKQASELGRCVSTIPQLNKNKEYSKKGQRVNYPIDDIKNESITSIATEMNIEAREGMWEYTEQKNPDHLADLDEFGSLDILKKSYQDNLVWAIAEMLTLSQKWGVPDDYREAILTYFIADVLNEYDCLAERLKDLGDYTKAGEKYHLEFLISQSISTAETFQDATISIVRELRLPNNAMLKR